LVVIGDPIEHSLSPLMWNAAFGALGLEKEFIYEPLKVKREELGKFVNRLRGGEILGANVTMPHKIGIMEYLDELTEEARSIGAVNTIYTENGAIIGENTDGVGCLRALGEKGVDARGKRVLILGAGGTARAISFVMALGGVGELIILNRTRGRGEELAKEINQRFSTRVIADDLSVVKEASKDADIIINCTSLGMSGGQREKTLITEGMLRPDQAVMDVVYNPLETRLLEEARKVGATTIRGIDMLVYQAAINFKRWTGRGAPVALMKKTLIERLSNRDKP